MWLFAPNISCIHGFSTREGGVSKSPFHSLNLGGSEDEPASITENRRLAFKALSLPPDSLCNLKQVHGNKVCLAKPGQQEGDALVTNKTGLTLAISIADCYPILFYDKVNQVIGAAHAGWRGTQAKIVENTLNEMCNLGADKKNIQVAIGQGICQNNFEVGPEVIAKFKEAGFPENCWKENKIDLIKCNLFALQQNGISEQQIWTMNRCTFESDFFSYRRDKGHTGRMWGLIALNKQSSAA
jgi:YfiH family protein